MTITGHRSIAIQPAVSAAVKAAMLDAMRRLMATPGRRLHVISMLAQGADLLGMQAGLECGAELSAVLPFDVTSYRTTFEHVGSLAEFDRVRQHLSSMVVLGGRLGDDGAYEVANVAMLERCDVLMAVWDGAPARGRGGTAEVVAQALALGLPVVLIRPSVDATAVLLTPDGERGFDAGAVTPRDRAGSAMAADRGKAKLSLRATPAGGAMSTDSGEGAVALRGGRWAAALRHFFGRNGFAIAAHRCKG